MKTPRCRDSGEFSFINLAIDGNAKLIVSGDSHLLKLKRHSGIEIITVSEFIKRFLK
jgi:predicted nucleic acid-binding protein